MSGMTTGHALRKPSLTERRHRNIGVVHSMRGEMGDACTIGTVAHVMRTTLRILKERGLHWRLHGHVPVVERNRKAALRCGCQSRGEHGTRIDRVRQLRV